MKKITSLLALLLMYFGMSAWAVDFVPQEGESYLIKNVAKGRYALHNVNCKDAKGNTILSNWNQYDGRSWFVIAKKGPDFVIRMANNEQNYVYAVTKESADHNVGVKTVVDGTTPEDCLWQIVDKGNGQWNIIPKGGSNSWNCRGNLGGNACIGQWDHNDEPDNKWYIQSSVDLYNEAKAIAQAALDKESKSVYVWKKTSGVAAVNAAMKLPVDTRENRLKAKDALNSAVVNFNKNVSVPTDKSFLLLNRKHNHYMSVDDTKTNLISSNKEEYSKWTFVNAENGKYQIFNALVNKYVAGLPSTNDTGTALTDAANAGFYTLEVIEKGGVEYLLLKDEKQDPSYLHSSNGKMVRWYGNLDCDASMWSLKNQPVQVTYNYMIDGVQVKSNTVTQYEGDALNPVNLNNPFISEYQFAEGVVASGMEPVEVTCVENLPFVKTTNTEKPIWYAVDIHINNYFWDAAAETGKVKTTVVNNDQKLTRFAEKGFQWCFMGNAVEGFKIFNAAKGFKQALTNANPYANFTDAKSAISWSLRNNAKNIANGFCFNSASGNLNRQDVNDNGGTLKYWGAFDEGSTCRFYPLGEMLSNPLLNDVKAILAVPVGAVGSYTYMNNAQQVEEMKQAYSVLSNDKNDVAAREALKTMYDAAIATEDVVFDATKLYRIKNALNNGFLDVEGTKMVPSTDANSLNTIWSLSAANGAATVKHMNSNLYASSISKGVADGTMADADGGFSVEPIAESKTHFGIHKSGMYLCHNKGANAIMGWNDAKIDNDHSWYLIPVETIDVAMKTPAGDNNSYASLYVPFGVGVREGTEAFTATIETMTKIKMHSAAKVPANNGMVLKAGKDVNKVTLDIVTDAPALVGENCLEGVNVATAKEAKTTYYVLNQVNNKIGFYTYTGETMAANRAFVKNQNPMTNGFVLDFGETTGVESVEFENPAAGQVIYDMTGRRVAKMTKGLYIVNGKKVLVK